MGSARARGCWPFVESSRGRRATAKRRSRPRPTDPRTARSSIGYGPTGRTVVRLLRENGIEPTVVELNIDTVRALREEGVDAVYGDATRPETLEARRRGRRPAA